MGARSRAGVLALAAVTLGGAGSALSGTAGPSSSVTARSPAALPGGSTRPDPGIPELGRPPVLDGDLSDWSGAPLLLRDAGGEVRAAVRFGYDETALYLALAIPDDTLTFPNRAWRFGDGFYLTVLMPGGGERTASHISLGIARSGDRAGAVVVNRSGEYFPPLSARDVRVAMRPDPAATPELADGVHAFGDTVRYEVAVPWSLLAPADPLTVDSLAVNVVVVDRDGGTGRHFGMLHPDPAFDTERTPLRAGRLLPLRRGAGGDGAAVRSPPVLHAGADAPVVVALRSSETEPGPAHLELSRADRPLGSWTVALPDAAPVRRATVELRLAPGVGTGPATLGFRSDGGRVADRTVFVLDGPELAAAEAELMNATVPPMERAPALLRLEWIREFAASPAANAPVSDPARWWQEYRTMAADLADGTLDAVRKPGPHRLAHRSRIDGTLQPYSVHLPDGFDPERAEPYPVLVALHGSGVDERGTLRSVGPQAAERGWVVVAPRGRGLSDWYVGDAGEDVVEALEHAAGLYPLDLTRVHLAGFSMGGHGAWRLLLLHPDRFRAVAVMAGADCPFGDVAGACVTELMDDHLGRAGPRPPVLLLHGARDNAVPVEDARRLAGRIDSAGWPHRYHEESDAAHGAASWWRQVLDWLEAGSPTP